MKFFVDSVIFDLDGTLWDATAVTERTWVKVLGDNPSVTPAIPLSRENVRKYMGITNEELTEVYFPELSFDEAFRLMQASCELENLWLPECGGELYDGVEEVLCELRSRGMGVYIVSNCQDGYIETFLDAHGMRDIVCDFECSGRTGMHKAENIRLIMERNGIGSALYVGDTVSDQRGARGAGIPFIYARYGFGELSDHARATEFDGEIEKLSDILSMISKK